VAKALKVKWLDEPEEEDYAAAQSYLSLLVPPGNLESVIAQLKRAPSGKWRAKDILRAARLPLLSAAQSDEVAEKLAKVRGRERLSPILMIVLLPDVVAQIADGYHRSCAAHLVNEDTLVPGRILFLSRRDPVTRSGARDRQPTAV
jgi:hypothetical protein